MYELDGVVIDDGQLKIRAFTIKNDKVFVLTILAAGQDHLSADNLKFDEESE
ncbi:MAG: hypothetical protein KDA60_01975 [Planctomycetales bacterium]|nr:hypothetical protein [Planctomycetales bacterium]